MILELVCLLHDFRTGTGDALGLAYRIKPRNQRFLVKMGWSVQDLTDRVNGHPHVAFENHGMVTAVIEQTRGIRDQLRLSEIKNALGRSGDAKAAHSC